MKFKSTFELSLHVKDLLFQNKDLFKGTTDAAFDAVDKEREAESE